ncbi:hypothetical protein EDB85DRAFT_2152221 [Lactarius pseudohatsudake]|nr:hypothetical protein EDB85DRAFT_2152221 [Lactarius pseudohatsudake]
METTDAQNATPAPPGPFHDHLCNAVRALASPGSRTTHILTPAPPASQAWCHGPGGAPVLCSLDSLRSCQSPRLLYHDLATATPLFVQCIHEVLACAPIETAAASAWFVVRASIPSLASLYSPLFPLLGVEIGLLGPTLQRQGPLKMHDNTLHPASYKYMPTLVGAYLSSLGGAARSYISRPNSNRRQVLDQPSVAKCFTS